METSTSLFALVVTLLLFSSFVKITTVLSVFRYGAGLVGFEFGAVCLVAAFGLAVASLPPEVLGSGFSDRFLSSSPSDNERIVKGMLPHMVKQADVDVLHGLYGAQVKIESLQQDVSRLLPVFVLSQLKAALTLGVMLLVPFVLLDLVVAHILSLVGIQQLGVQVVSLPLKILLFLAVDGWGMLGAKLLGGPA